MIHDLYEARNNKQPSGTLTRVSSYEVTVRREYVKRNGEITSNLAVKRFVDWYHGQGAPSSSLFNLFTRAVLAHLTLPLALLSVVYSRRLFATPGFVSPARDRTYKQPTNSRNYPDFAQKDDLSFRN